MKENCGRQMAHPITCQVLFVLLILKLHMLFFLSFREWLPRWFSVVNYLEHKVSAHQSLQQFTVIHSAFVSQCCTLVPAVTFISLFFFFFWLLTLGVTIFDPLPPFHPTPCILFCYTNTIHSFTPWIFSHSSFPPYWQLHLSILYLVCPLHAHVLSLVSLWLHTVQPELM